MVLDTSGIIAILLREPESGMFAQVLAASPPLAISAPTLHEASIVIAGMARQSSVRLFDEFVRNLAIEVCGVAVEDALSARNAHFKYGRGHHPAALNLADCFSYALAKLRNEPPLFMGDDLAKMDVVAAWRRKACAASSKTCRPRLRETGRQ
jgi:ribonuclease VapC